MIFEDAQYDVDTVYVDQASKEPAAVGVLRERLTWHVLDKTFEETFVGRFEK